jgi:hypothetical protein
MTKHLFPLVLALVVGGSGVAAAQGLVPACLQPDRGVVRMVPGLQACQPGEVGVALQLRQAPAALPVQPPAAERQVMLRQAARPDAAVAEFFSADRAAAPLRLPASRTSSTLAVPAARTLVVVGAGLMPIR